MEEDTATGPYVRALPDIRGARYNMKGFLPQCVERYLELSGLTEGSLRKVGTPKLDDHVVKQEDFEAKNPLAKAAASIIMKMTSTDKINSLKFSMRSSKPEEQKSRPRRRLNSKNRPHPPPLLCHKKTQL